MKRLLYFLSIVVATVLIVSSCSREDDIDEIFTDKTWRMTGATLNGKIWGGEKVRGFYSDPNPSAYTISFASGTFTGMLSSGATFGGTWSANGKEQTIKMNFSKLPALEKEFDREVFSIVKGIKYYRGDSRNIEFHADKDNYITSIDSKDYE